MKLLTRIFFLTLATISVSSGASIVSTLRNTYLADNGGSDLYSVSSGGPSFETREHWKYSGNVVLVSDPNEQIYSLVLSFTRNPNQASTWMEEDTLSWNGSTGYLAQGYLTQVSTDSLGQEFQTWGVDWATSYPGSPWNSAFAYWFQQSRYINGAPIERVKVYGTATISVISSAGQYDVASYPYFYNGILEPIPEPSTISIFIAIVSFSMIRRHRS